MNQEKPYSVRSTDWRMGRDQRRARRSQTAMRADGGGGCAAEGMASLDAPRGAIVLKGVNGSDSADTETGALALVAADRCCSWLSALDSLTTN